jgi:hypothetical protein
VDVGAEVATSTAIGVGAGDAGGGRVVPSHAIDTTKAVATIMVSNGRRTSARLVICPMRRLHAYPDCHGEMGSDVATPFPGG